MSTSTRQSFTPLDVESCDRLLSTTRAVRRGLDLDRPVGRDVIEDCLRQALQAPNGSNRQDWRWLLITDPDRRAAVADIYRRAFYARTAAAAAGGIAPRGDARAMRDAHILAECMHRVPVLLLPCLELGRPLPTGNQAGVWSSVLPAAWSYALAARSRGLGTTFTTCHLDLESDMADLLGLPSHVYQGPLIPTAYATRRDFSPGRRRPLEDVLHVDGWDREAAARVAAWPEPAGPSGSTTHAAQAAR
ncbi:MAG TPA: nitroreductase family protein [Actinocrinis sp.]|nr:nitroreductase family protein [Actinocrinis sp.]